MNLSGSSIRFRAYHYEPEEGWHAHAWRLTAEWCPKPWRDGIHAQERMRQEIDRLTVIEDGQRRFPLPLWSNESILEQIELQQYVVKITLTRPGFHAFVWRAA